MVRAEALTTELCSLSGEDCVAKRFNTRFASGGIGVRLLTESHSFLSATSRGYPKDRGRHRLLLYPLVVPGPRASPAVVLTKRIPSGE